MRWLDRYMAIPFKDKGREFDGADCFGFYLLIIGNEAKIPISDIDVTFRSPLNAMRKVELEIMSGRWKSVAVGNGAAVKAHANCFDLVHMSSHARIGDGFRNADLHVGCALGNGMMVHIEKDCGAHYLAMDDSTIQSRVKAIYRPKALCA